MNDRLVERRRGDLLLSTDRARIDHPAVLAMLHDSHWGGSVRADVLARAIDNSLCIGVYEDARQLAFARAVTDLSTYAYLTDVIVAGDARRRGIGSWMIEEILAHPGSSGASPDRVAHARCAGTVRTIRVLHPNGDLYIYGTASPDALIPRVLLSVTRFARHPVPEP